MKNRMFIIKVLTAVIAMLGIIMLISGIVLRNLDEKSRTTSDKPKMPEEYIEEFFSGDDRAPSIEDYIEAEE